ncbi:DUF2029 domain-containing protein, partial [bacterium]
YSKFASAALAVPAGIKIYPILLPAIFLLQRRPKAFAVAMIFAALTLALPFLAYGNRVPELTTSFWNNAIASGSSSSRIKESQRANSVNNQGIDSIMLRYLTTGQELHERNPGFPHLALDRALVIRLTNILRLLVLLVTAIAAWRAWPRLEKTPLWGTFLLMALGCACLYVLLPGTKSRYAIYTFLAFVPLIIQAIAAQKLRLQKDFWLWSTAVVLLTLLCMQFVPQAFRVYGICFMGHLALWVLNVVLVWRVGNRRIAGSLKA